ncbi:MAG: CDP-glycerol glycerophosphotransferase family protein, partial [Erysipelotrichales bacterium]
EMLDKHGFEVVFLIKYMIDSKEYIYHLETAKIIIFESWSNIKYKKKDSQIYIQLWHGSPLKKFLFSSSEPYIMQMNHNSRRKKFNDYSKWDYFLVDQDIDIELYNEIFSYNTFKYLDYGYPKVKWLFDNKENELMKKNIKKKLNLTKPVILYTPTWRDINLVEPDNKSYLLDIQSLQDKYSEYEFISMEHFYLNERIDKVDIQELILISDLIISDYSSIIFDAIAIQKKILLYHNDYQDFNAYRGLYHDRFKLFKDNICFSESEIKKKLDNIDSIKTYPSNSISSYENTINSFNKLFKDIIKEEDT